MNISASTSKRKFPVLATFCTLLGCAVLITLGTWQIKRLHWKTDIIQAIQAQKNVDAAQKELSINDIADLNNQTYPFVRGFIKGKLNNSDHLIFLTPRINASGTVGTELVIALQSSMNDHKPILVNLGWVPSSDKIYAQILDNIDLKLEGHFKNSPRPNSFTPANRAEQGFWSHIDVTYLEREFGLTFLTPFVFYNENLVFEKMPPALKANVPMPQEFSKQWQPYNKHLEYAIFWYVMAGLLIVIYILRFFVPYIYAGHKQE